MRIYYHPASTTSRPVMLFASPWDLEYFENHHPNVPLLDESPVSLPAKK